MELPVIQTNIGAMYFDARCMQLRSKVKFPEEIKFIDLKDYDVEYIGMQDIKHHKFMLDSYGLVS